MEGFLAHYENTDDYGYTAQFGMEGRVWKGLSSTAAQMVRREECPPPLGSGRAQVPSRGRARGVPAGVPGRRCSVRACPGKLLRRQGDPDSEGVREKSESFQMQ